MIAGYVSVPFFPSLKGKELAYVIDFGDVDALFVGKIETWDEIKNDLPKDMPLISFPTYKGFSNITKGYQWFDFINKFEPLMEPNVPKLSDLWTIIFTSDLVTEPMRTGNSSPSWPPQGNASTGRTAH